MKQRICIIGGPTASGKSSISLKIAKSLNGEIISADSAQVYKFMNIGTAKLTNDEMEDIHHYMIDEVYPDEKFSVAVFRRKAKEYINDITMKGKIPIIVGGTGLYIKSLLDNLDFTDSIINDDYRNYMRAEAKEKGNAYVHSKLQNIDPISYNKLHQNDLKRVIRALEVYEYTGKPISFFQEESQKLPSPYDFAYVCINAKRETIYNRVNDRVDSMIENGLIEEVACLLEKGYNSKLSSMQALGYKEIVSYIEGKVTKDEAIELLKKNTRHYAKRQVTWFKGDSRIFWINVEGYKSLKDIEESLIRYFSCKFPLL